MSMMCPPHSVKMVSTPSFLRALATRWPPETMLGSALLRARVSWAVACVDLTACAVAMKTSLALPDETSVQMIGVARDMLGKAERVLAHQGLGPLGFAPFEGLDDVHMIADRSIGAVVFADRLAADHPHVGEQVLGEIDQHLVVTHLDDGLVKADVDLGIFVEPGVNPAVREGGEHRPQSRDLLVRGVAGDQPRGHALQGRPGGDHLDHFPLGLAHHIDAAPRNRTHEPLALELRHGFANRGAADAEILGEPALVEAHLALALVDVKRYDDVAQGAVGAIRKR